MYKRIGPSAKYFGVSESLLRKLIKEGRIPFYKLGPRTTLLHLEEIRDYMKLVAGGVGE